jgi:hypothetical protein
MAILVAHARTFPASLCQDARRYIFHIEGGSTKNSERLVGCPKTYYIP